MPLRGFLGVGFVRRRGFFDGWAAEGWGCVGLDLIELVCVEFVFEGEEDERGG